MKSKWSKIKSRVYDDHCNIKVKIPAANAIKKICTCETFPISIGEEDGINTNGGVKTYNKAITNPVTNKDDGSLESVWSGDENDANP